MSVVDWPPQISDCNVIEVVWDHSSEQKAPRIQRSAVIVLRESWRAIPEDCLACLKVFRLC